MSNDENKFQPIFQILDIKSAWFSTPFQFQFSVYFNEENLRYKISMKSDSTVYENGDSTMHALYYLSAS